MRPNMIAISVLFWWLPSFQKLKSISCKAYSLPVKSDWLKWCAIKRRILCSNQIGPETIVFYRKLILNFEKMASIPSPYEKRWQAYLVPNKNDMASMFGPIFYQHSKHTWSLIFITWQAYPVPKEIYMASIPGPSCFEYGKHVWSAT